MPGFFICNKTVNIELSDYYNDHCLSSLLNVDTFTIKRNTLDKFLDDKLFAQDDDIVLITEGVILNKKELCEKYSSDFFHTSKQMLHIDGNEFFKHFRGTFSGAVYNKKTDVWIVFVSQTGDKPIFYYYDSDVFVAASNELYIVDALKQLGIAYKPDEKAMYELLTYGFMVSNRTLIASIQTIQAGHYIEFSDHNIRKYEYHRFNNTNTLMDNWTEDEIIEKLDELFIEAVRLEYEKDKEYGYRHITELSGGLDSRMNLWIANELGYTDIMSLNFGQADYYDEKIAKKVADYWGTELLIKPLDDAKLLFDFREIVKMNYGLTIYYGSAHVNRIHQYINYHDFGLIHSGQIGDAVIGTHISTQTQTPPIPFDGAYSNFLADKLSDDDETYENNELRFFYTRAFRGVLTSQLLRQNYSEIISPFIYLEFFEFCLQIPLSLRRNHKIYYKWIQKKHPEVATIPLERCNGGYLFEGKLLQNIRKAKKLGIRRILLWVLYKVGVIREWCYELDTKEHMNPIDYWYNSKPALRTVLDEYCKSQLARLDAEKLLSYNLLDDISKLYNTNNTTNKTLALTVLAASELFW